MGIMETSRLVAHDADILSLDGIHILLHVKSMIPALSKSDAKIARLLLKSPTEFIRSSVKTIAVDVGVSEPTITRFCRNIGCEGFKDLRFKVMQELAMSKVYSEMPDAVGDTLRVPVYVKTERHSVSENVFTKAMEAMRSSCNAADFPTVQKAALAIMQAHRIFIYGTGGGSALLAGELHDRLVRLNVITSVFNDNYGQLMSSATLERRDLVVFISPGGRARTLQDTLELAKHSGATCIAITDSGSLLGREADICLHVAENTPGIHEFQPSPIRYSQLLVVDTLVYILALELGDKARQSLRRVHASVATMNGLSAQLPVNE